MPLISFYYTFFSIRIEKVGESLKLKNITLPTFVVRLVCKVVSILFDDSNKSNFMFINLVFLIYSETSTSEEN